MKLKKLLIFAVTILSTITLFAQIIDMDKVESEQEFQWGVRAFHNGYFNKAHQSFERALSYEPSDSLIQMWLGETLYRSGFEETALSIWEGMRDNGMATSLLLNTIDVINQRRGLASDLAGAARYVTFYEVDGVHEKYNLFLRPASVIPADNAGFIITSYATNEIILFNANGAIRRKLFGGLDGINHPFDIVDPGEGYYFISEYRGDTILRMNYDDGDYLRFGGPGRGEGSLIGPQYMAIDNKGYLYVTEIGNRRVSKFDFDGNFILSFGKKQGDFSGIKAPSGVCVINDRVFVADLFGKAIHEFDLSGNYIQSYSDQRLTAPEGLSVYDDGRILVANSTSILELTLRTKVFRQISDLKGGKITKVVLDQNQNIVTVDYNNNTINVLTELPNLYSGMFVQIDRIDSSDFPKVKMDVSVSTRRGDPVSGLEVNNFLVTENTNSVRNLNLYYVGDRSSILHTCFVVEQSADMMKQELLLSQAFDELTSVMASPDTSAVIAAGEYAAFSQTRTSSELVNLDFGEVPASDDWVFDQALRLAATDLIPHRDKKAVVLLTSGEMGSDSFAQYNLVEMSQYLKNNGILFYCIYLNGDYSPVDEFEYICQETGGRSVSVFDPKGVAEIISEMRKSQSGRYTLEYTSSSRTDFGDKYIPVELETILYNLTGRDELGYFAPIE